MKQERVELHLHTNMSALDGISSAEKLVRRAAELGHKAVAITDHGVVQAFPEAMKIAERLAKAGQDIKILYGVEGYLIDNSTNEETENQPVYHITLLAQNKRGLKNLYKLISVSHLQYCYKDKPHIPKSELIKYRDGLLVGSACKQGELFGAVVSGKPWDELCKIAELYDYLEIQPISNNESLLHKGLAQNKEQLQDFNRTVVRLGDELKIPVCATGDVHFCMPEDEICRNILLAGQNSAEANNQPPLYFRSTDDMIAEFSYLGDEKAYEVVVENTNRIADSIERLSPIPKGLHYPKIDGAEEMLQAFVVNRAKEIYGDPLPQIVKERINNELSHIIDNGYATLYIITQKLVKDSVEHGYLVGARGTVGASLVAYLADITDVNPLVPHYVCPKCRYSEFFTDGSVGSGFDLPEKTCPKCSEALHRDGHEIPYEVFLGFNGNKVPDIDLNFSDEYQPAVFECLQSLFEKEHVFKAGTIGTLSYLTAKRYVNKYAEEHKLTLEESEIERLTEGCTGVKRMTGQHPAGAMVIPENCEVYDFTPIQYSANDTEGEIVTHFANFYLYDTILKMDFLSHPTPTMYKYLEEYTGISVTDVPLCDPQVYSLFTSPKALGVTAEEIGCKTGTLSLPELETEFVQKMLTETQPKNFTDIMRISGMSHGTNVWLDNAQELIKDGVCTLSEVITTREDIMNYLIHKGIEPQMAYEIMETVRKGQASKKITETHINAMLNCGVPNWYIDSCMKIKYIFPKAHTASYMIADVRLGWYKIYRPTEYYAAYFTVHKCNLEEGNFLKGKDDIKNMLDEICSKGEYISWKEKSIYNTSRIVYEAMARGIEFLPPHPCKSHKTKFLAENGKIRLPLVLSD